MLGWQLILLLPVLEASNRFARLATGLYHAYSQVGQPTQRTRWRIRHPSEFLNLDPATSSGGRRNTRIPTSNLLSWGLFSGQDQAVDVVELEPVKQEGEDFKLVWLRALVFAAQKIKMKELEAKVKDKEELQALYDELHKNHLEMAKKLGQSRQANRDLQERLEVAETERDQAIHRLKETVTGLEGELGQAMDRCKFTQSLNDQMLRNTEEMNDQLADKAKRITGLELMLQEAKKTIAEKLDAIDLSSQQWRAREHDLTKTLDEAKRKADTRKAKLVDARMELEKGRKNIALLEEDLAGLTAIRSNLTDTIKNLRKDLEDVASKHEKSERLTREAEQSLRITAMDLRRAKEELSQAEYAIRGKDSAIGDAKEIKEALTKSVEELAKLVEEKTGDLREANSDLAAVQEKLRDLTSEHETKIKELEVLKDKIRKLEEGKLEAALALGLHGDDLNDPQFDDIVGIIKAHELRLEGALEETSKLKQTSGALKAKLEAVAKKLGSHPDDVLTDKIDDLLKELEAEHLSNQEKQKCLVKTSQHTKDISKAASELEKVHDQECKERDQLASNQTILIQKLRDMSKELDKVRKEFLRSLEDTTDDMTLKKSLSDARTEIYSLKLDSFEERMDKNRLAEENLEQIEKIKELAEKKKELEENLAQTFADLENSKGFSDKIQATLHDLQGQFEVQTAKHAELQQEFDRLQSELKATKSSLVEREDAITNLKSEIRSLNESKDRFIAAVGGVFEIELNEADAVPKLVGILQKHHSDIDSLRREVSAVTEDREAIKKSLETELEALRRETAEQHESDQAGLFKYASELALLGQHNKTLEQENTGLESNIKTRIATIEKLQAQLKESEKMQSNLSAKIDEMTSKLLEAHENYGAVKEALEEMTNTAKNNQALLESAWKDLEHSHKTVAKISAERDQWIEKQKEDRLLSNAFISELEQKLEKKKAKIAAEREKTTKMARIHEEAMKEVKAMMEKSFRATDERVADLEGKVMALEEERETSLAEIKEKNGQLKDLQAEYNKATESVANLEEELERQAAELKREMGERANENAIYQANDLRYTHDMGTLRNEMLRLEQEKTGLDKDVKSRIEAIKELQTKLEASKQNHAALSDKLDEMFKKYSEAQSAFEKVQEQLLEKQKVLQKTLDELELSTATSAKLLKERDEAIQMGLHVDEARSALIKECETMQKKLAKKKTTLAAERSIAENSSQAYAKLILELKEKSNVDMAEKQKLAEELKEKDNQLESLREKCNEAVQDINALEQELAAETAKLKTEVEGRANDNLQLQKHIGAIEKLQMKLEAAKMKHAELEAERDDMFYKYVDAESDHERALEQLVESQHAYQEALDLLSITDEKATALAKELVEAVEKGFKAAEDNLRLAGEFGQVKTNLGLEQIKLEGEKRLAADTAKLYEDIIAELHKKAEADRAEKKRLKEALRNEMFARKLDGLDIDDLKDQVNRLQAEKTRLDEERKRLQEARLVPDDTSNEYEKAFTALDEKIRADRAEKQRLEKELLNEKYAVQNREQDAEALEAHVARLEAGKKNIEDVKKRLEEDRLAAASNAQAYEKYFSELNDKILADVAEKKQLVIELSNEKNEKFEATGKAAEYEKAISELGDKGQADLAEKEQLMKELLNEQKEKLAAAGKADEYEKAIAELDKKAKADLEEKKILKEKLLASNNELGMLKIQCEAAAKDIGLLEAQLAMEAAKLKREIDERVSEKNDYQNKYALSLASLKSDIAHLEQEKQGLDQTVQNHIKAIKELQQKLDTAENRQASLEAERNDLYSKYIHAQRVYKLALQRLVKNQKDYKLALDSLLMTNKKTSKERDDALQAILHKDKQYAAVTKKLGDKKRKLAGAKLAHQNSLSRMAQKVKAEIAEKKRLEQDLTNERSDHQNQVRKLQDEKKKLEDEKKKLEDEKAKLLKLSVVPTPSAVPIGVPTPTVVPGGVPTPTIVPIGVPTPTVVPGGVPTPTIVPIGVPTPTVAPGGVPTPTVVPGGIPTPAVVPGGGPATPVVPAATPTTVYVPVYQRCPSCDDCESDVLIVSNTVENYTPLDTIQLSERPVKIVTEQCKNVEVANLTLFISGLTCFSAGLGLVGYWFIRLRPLITAATVQA